MKSKKVRWETWRTTDAEERAKRQARAKVEPMKVRTVDAPDGFGLYEVSHPAADRRTATYHVEIRSLDAPVNTCDCPDFVKSGLGTCKHIERALKTAARKCGSRRTSSVAEVFMGLDPHVPLFVAGNKLSNETRKMLQRLCAADGSVKDLTAAGVDVFLRTCGRINEITPGSVRVSFAVRRWLEAKLRQETLARAVAEFGEEQGDDGRWPFLKKTLFPYQREGAMHLAGKGRAILADEMGLGKTVQGIAAALLKLFGSLFRFNRRFYAFDSEGKNEGMCNLDKLHEATASILLRRRKSAVEDELPGRMTKTYKTGMTPEQERRYSAHFQTVAGLYQTSKRRPLSPKEQERLQIELGLMRMLCDTCYITDQKIKDSPKLDEFEDVLDDILAADEAAGEDGRHPVQRRGSPECRCAHRTGRGAGRGRETACESRKGVRRRAASAGYGRPVDERRLCA